jgi:hypothetical protein
MKAVDISKMEELYEYRQRLLERMEGVIEDLRKAASSASSKEWRTAPPEDQPTPHWILAHLRNIEVQALAPRIKKILNEDDPHLILFDDDHWMEINYDPDEPVEAMIDEYERIRNEEMSWLEEMDISGWSRTGRHPWFGVRTLQWWVEKTLAYAEEHLEDINAVLYNNNREKLS